MIVAAAFIFIFGTIIGSFLNVVIFRFNTGETLGGRSKCFSCGKGIKWYDLVPIASFCALGGKCRFCKSKISPQYVLVELLTGAIFAAIFISQSSAGPLLLSFYFFVFCLFILIAVYDFKHKIIPDIFAFLLAASGLLRLISEFPVQSLFSFPHILDLFAGPIVALPLFLLWLLSGGRWIGLGDSKLALGIGWFLGFSLGVSAMVVGFWVGAAVSILLLGFSRFSRASFAKSFLSFFGMRRVEMNSEVPLAPFLIIGAFMVFFWRYDVANFGVLIQQL